MTSDWWFFRNILPFYTDNCPCNAPPYVFHYLFEVVPAGYNKSFYLFVWRIFDGLAVFFFSTKVPRILWVKEHHKKEKGKVIQDQAKKENRISKPPRGPPKPKFNKLIIKPQTTTGGSSQDNQKEVRAKTLTQLPSGFVYGPKVLEEKLEVEDTKCKMELGNPTPDGKEVWKVNNEWSVAEKTVTAKRCSRNTCSLKQGKKVLTAIETGIMAFEEGEELKRLELLQLLKSVKNGISQIISSMGSEAIEAKYKQMKDEIRKQEPQFMSNDLAIKISFIDINESRELD
uniref:BAG domain-containing protein n=1 Tax=Strongyloides venezuelensis TaxID=75913 RepID=A0A0K0FRT8_STRVS